MMKALKILNKINIWILAAYIPYIILFWEDFFFGKSKDGGIAALAFILFFTTFVCSGAIFITANYKNVERAFSFSDIKQVSKGTLIFLGVVYSAGVILTAVFIRGEGEIFYIITSTIALIFVIIQKILIKKIYSSPYFKIMLPWYLYFIPFVFLFGGLMTAAYTVSEENQGAVIFVLFIAAGIMMAYCAWHSYFVVDEQAKTIEKNRGILTLFGANTQTICFDNIKYVEKNRFYYVLVCSGSEIKISRMYSGAKRLENTLRNNKKM